MIPVLTPEEMGRVDGAATEPTSVLVGRAGLAVSRTALAMLERRYGARVVVVEGKGNNGNDGRAAARLLGCRGVDVVEVDAATLVGGAPLPAADLVIDAAYGTGLQRAYHPPDPGGAAVLAVDIPSGLSGLTGQLSGGGAMRAATTVTFASLKPGLLLGSGPNLAGRVEVADIGLGTLVNREARCWLVQDGDVSWLPVRSRDAHKWQSAVAVVAGSPGMTGAPWMVSHGALRAGAGYVRLGMPGVDLASSPLPPSEVVTVALPAGGWEKAATDGLERCQALVIGPGLGPVAGGSGGGGRGRAAGVGAGGPVGRLVAAAPLPVVIDADGINALGSLDALAEVVSERRHPTVVTPHAGEFARLVGEAPGEDRVASVRDAARRSGAVVLLKGSTTVVAHPDGRVLMAAAGSSRLATAGTGDVLSGVVGAFIARGVPAWEGAALAAHVHGRASGLGWSQGLTALDLPLLVARWLSEWLP